jgi:hypothetical protein
MKALGAAAAISVPMLSSTGLAEHVDLAALTRGLPPKVAAVIDREDVRNHWAGEEPYGKARARSPGR